MGAPEALLKVDLSNEGNMLASKYKGFSQVLGGAFLVTGTCIGAGMLGLPVETAAGGLMPTFFFMLVVWGFMTFTALVMLEVALFLRGETNFISMATTTLGPWGGRIAWVTYLLFLYSLMAAYTAGGTTMLADALGVVIDHTGELLMITMVFVVPFIWLVYKGASWVDIINRGFIMGLVLSFMMVVLSIQGKSNGHLVVWGEAKYLAFTLPLLTTSFGFHLLVPTLKTYLEENVKKLRLAIVLGSTIPMVVYLFWVYITFNYVPTYGETGLVGMLHGKSNPGEMLIHALGGDNQYILAAVSFFTFFALVSSFMGVALGLFDFFSDGLHIKKTMRGKFILAFLTFIPPAIFTITYPKGFLLALGYAGVFASILLIIYPSLMAWFGRYRSKVNNDRYQVFGGKFTLALAMLFGVVVVLAEFGGQLGILPIPH